MFVSIHIWTNLCSRVMTVPRTEPSFYWLIWWIYNGALSCSLAKKVPRFHSSWKSVVLFGTTSKAEWLTSSQTQRFPEITDDKVASNRCKHHQQTYPRKDTTHFSCYSCKSLANKVLFYTFCMDLIFSPVCVLHSNYNDLRKLIKNHRGKDASKIRLGNFFNKYIILHICGAFLIT